MTTTECFKRGSSLTLNPCAQVMSAVRQRPTFSEIARKVGVGI